MTTKKNTGVVFLHGLESGPEGTKARWLRERFGAFTPALDTSEAVACRDDALRQGREWSAPSLVLQHALQEPLRQASEAMAATPDLGLVIGSSFGGALLLRLVHNEVWSGPCLFLAGAGPKLCALHTLPEGLRAILIHGRDDDVVSLEDSRRLARSGGRHVQLWEVGDGHRLSSTLEDGTLELAISWLRG